MEHELLTCCAMRNSFVRTGVLGSCLLTLTSLAQAHPGHDDGHELTWDFRHLAAHPGATTICLTLLGLGAWSLFRAMRPDGLLRQAIRNRRDDR
jgi:hypothetical protein